MSNDVQNPTPAQAPAPAPEAKPARKGLTSAEILAKLNGKSESVAPANVQEKAGESAVHAPTDKPADSASKPDHRTAQAILKAQKAEAEALKHRQGLEAANKRLAELEARIEAASKDPVAALKLANLDPVSFGEKMLRGEISAETASKMELPAEVQELLSEAKQRKEQQKLEAEKAEKAKARQADLEVVKQSVEAVKADFPVLSTLPYIAEQLLTVIEQSGGVESVSQEDFVSLCKQVQTNVVAEAASLLKSPVVLGEILKVEGIKDALLSALGTQPPAERTEQSPSERTEGTESAPRTLTNRGTSRVPSRTKASSSADLAAKINASLFGR